MKNQLFTFALLLFINLSFGQTNILPTPSFVEMSDGQFVLNDNVLSIESGVFSNNQLRVLQAHFGALGVTLSESKSNPDVTFSYRKHLLPEAYGIEIDKKIDIAYNTNAGQLYGLVSLLQLIDFSIEDEFTIPKLSLEDAPQFEWRGLHLDVSRHFFTVDEVKEFIETMAFYKFNTFHWHLTDDQGWRIEIKKYPELTQIGGFRDSTVVGHFTDTPRQYEQTRYGGFYTQQEIKEVVAFAKELQIHVVPEIEMPGHSRAALAAYPELSCTGEQQGVPGLWGVFDDIYCSKEESILFLQDVLDEVLELFPSEYIHIGGDEAPKSRWNACSKCKKVMEENALHDAHELQSYFIKRMDQYLTAKGRKLIGWDEILEGGLSPNAAVMSWRGEAGGIEAAKQGHYVVMSPTSYCYFDYYQSSHESEPLAIGGFLPLEKVYEFNPVPADLSEEEAKFILGGQANVWTEYIPTYNQVEYMVYPRAIALMQSLWCQKKPTYDAFLKVYLDFHEPYLKDRKVNRSQSIHIPELKIERTTEGVAYSWWGLDPMEEFIFADSYNDVVGGVYHLKNGSAIEFKKGGRGSHELELTYNTGDKIHYTLHQSDVLGAEIEMNPLPHKKYNHNGSLNLVDGILGTERWKGDQWLGFNSEKVELVIALDSIVKIRNFTIGFLNQNGSWIYLPESMKISISDNRTDWSELKNIPIEGDAIVNRQKIALNSEGRFVKVEIFPMEKIPEGNGGAGYTPWTFIDEIQMFTE